MASVTTGNESLMKPSSFKFKMGNGPLFGPNRPTASAAVQSSPGGLRQNTFFLSSPVLENTLDLSISEDHQSNADEMLEHSLDNCIFNQETPQVENLLDETAGQLSKHLDVQSGNIANFIELLDEQNRLHQQLKGSSKSSKICFC